MAGLWYISTQEKAVNWSSFYKGRYFYKMETGSLIVLLGLSCDNFMMLKQHRAPHVLAPVLSVSCGLPWSNHSWCREDQRGGSHSCAVAESGLRLRSALITPLHNLPSSQPRDYHSGIWATQPNMNAGATPSTVGTDFHLRLVVNLKWTKRIIEFNVRLPNEIKTITSLIQYVSHMAKQWHKSMWEGQYNGYLNMFQFKMKYRSNFSIF